MIFLVLGLEKSRGLRLPLGNGIIVEHRSQPEGSSPNLLFPGTITSKPFSHRTREHMLEEGKDS